jgi:hypothetical protein
VAGPIWPDRPRSLDFGLMTQLAALLAKDVLRAHRHLLTVALPEALGPRPEQSRRPALSSVFPQLLRKTSSSTSTSLPPSLTWKGPLPPSGRAAGAARERGMEAPPKFWGCGGRRQRRSRGSASSSLVSNYNTHNYILLTMEYMIKYICFWTSVCACMSA